MEKKFVANEKHYIASEAKRKDKSDQFWVFTAWKCPSHQKCISWLTDSETSIGPVKIQTVSLFPKCYQQCSWFSVVTTKDHVTTIISGKPNKHIKNYQKIYSKNQMRKSIHIKDIKIVSTVCRIRGLLYIWLLYDI